LAVPPTPKFGYSTFQNATRVLAQRAASFDPPVLDVNAYLNDADVDLQREFVFEPPSTGAPSPLQGLTDQAGKPLDEEGGSLHENGVDDFHECQELWSSCGQAGTVLQVQASVASNASGSLSPQTVGWRHIWLLAEWDDVGTQVRVPLDALFHRTKGHAIPVQALGISFNLTTGTIHLPMPFWHRAQLHLCSSWRASEPLVVRARVVATHRRVYEHGRGLYFAVAYKGTAQTAGGYPDILLHEHGAGKVVGILDRAVQLAENTPTLDKVANYFKDPRYIPKDNIKSYEGDIHFHADHSMSSWMEGTGFEDWIGFAHGMRFTSLPLLGNTCKEEDTPGIVPHSRWCGYRINLFDPMHFNSEALLTLDRADGSARNSAPGSRRSTTLFYTSGTSRNGMERRDEMSVFYATWEGDRMPAMKRFKYSAPSASPIHANGAFMGSRDAGKFHFMGHLLHPKHGSTFKMRVGGPHEQLVLRRGLSHLFCNQEA